MEDGISKEDFVMSMETLSNTGQMDVPLLVGRLESARLCSVSSASWDRLTASGKTPKSIKLGGRVVWRRTDLEAWISHGCPDRKTFETLMAQDR